MDLDTTTWILGLFAALIGFGALYWWRTGAEKKDVALLGAMSGACAAGAAVTLAV